MKHPNKPFTWAGVGWTFALLIYVIAVSGLINS